MLEILVEKELEVCVVILSFLGRRTLSQSQCQLQDERELLLLLLLYDDRFYSSTLLSSTQMALGRGRRYCMSLEHDDKPKRKGTSSPKELRTKVPCGTLSVPKMLV